MTEQSIRYRFPYEHDDIMRKNQPETIERNGATRCPGREGKDLRSKEIGQG
jgi:hypothetical protein